MELEKGNSVARSIKPKLDELYGNYPNLTDNQIKYVAFVTNPENILKGFTEAEIAEVIGVDKRQLYTYRQDSEVREAITKEQLLKASDDFPSMIVDLRDMALAKNKYTDISVSHQIKAKEVWLKIFGFVDEARQKNVEAKKELSSSFEKRLQEIDKKYIRDIGEDKE